MTLEEAIKHAEDKAKELENTPCGRQHEQLAIWLRKVASEGMILYTKNKDPTLWDIIIVFIMFIIMLLFIYR
jgi:uncharacterized integral membrane protein